MKTTQQFSELSSLFDIFNKEKAFTNPNTSDEDRHIKLYSYFHKFIDQNVIYIKKDKNGTQILNQKLSWELIQQYLKDIYHYDLNLSKFKDSVLRDTFKKCRDKRTATGDGKPVYYNFTKKDKAEYVLNIFKTYIPNFNFLNNLKVTKNSGDHKGYSFSLSESDDWAFRNSEPFAPFELLFDQFKTICPKPENNLETYQKIHSFFYKEINSDRITDKNEILTITWNLIQEKLLENYGFQFNYNQFKTDLLVDITNKKILDPTPQYSNIYYNFSNKEEAKRCLSIIQMNLADSTEKDNIMKTKVNKINPHIKIPGKTHTFFLNSLQKSNIENIINIHNTFIKPTAKENIKPDPENKAAQNEMPGMDKSKSHSLFFSMQSVNYIDTLLNEKDSFPKSNNKIGQLSKRAISSTVLFTGPKGSNIRSRTYKGNIGIVLNPFEINITQGDIHASNSFGRIVEENEKNKAEAHTIPADSKMYKLTSKHSAKVGYLRSDKGDYVRHTFVTNLARKDPNDSSVYHAQGSADNFAAAIQNIYIEHSSEEHKKKVAEGKKKNKGYVIGYQDMKLNEGITYQKGNTNPVAGIFITEAPSQADAKKLATLLNTHNNIRLYIYDSDAGEYVARSLDNEKAITYLNSLTEDPWHNRLLHSKSFMEAELFAGFSKDNHQPTFLPPLYKSEPITKAMLGKIYNYLKNLNSTYMHKIDEAKTSEERCKLAMRLLRDELKTNIAVIGTNGDNGYFIQYKNDSIFETFLDKNIKGVEKEATPAQPVKTEAQLEDELFKAINNKDLKSVENKIKANPWLLGRSNNPNKLTPLNHIISMAPKPPSTKYVPIPDNNEWLELAKQILTDYPNYYSLAAQDISGNTILHRAAYRGYKTIVDQIVEIAQKNGSLKKLLEITNYTYGSDVNGETPLKNDQYGVLARALASQPKQPAPPSKQQPQPVSVNAATNKPSVINQAQHTQPQKTDSPQPITSTAAPKPITSNTPPQPAAVNQAQQAQPQKPAPSQPIMSTPSPQPATIDQGQKPTSNVLDQPPKLFSPKELRQLYFYIKLNDKITQENKNKLNTLSSKDRFEHAMKILGINVQFNSFNENQGLFATATNAEFKTLSKCIEDGKIITELFDAFKEGNLNKISHKIAKHPFLLKAQDEKGFTPLQHMIDLIAKTSDKNMKTALLELFQNCLANYKDRYNLLSQDNNGNTLLHHAASNAQLDTKNMTIVMESIKNVAKHTNLHTIINNQGHTADQLFAKELPLPKQHVLNRIQSIMSAITQNIENEKRYHYRSSLFSQKDTPYAKATYVKDAFKTCNKECTEKNYDAAIQSFKVFIICCMENKEGNDWHNSKKTKTGEEIIELLNGNNNGKSASAKKDLIVALIGQNNIQEIKYEHLASALFKSPAFDIASKDFINKNKTVKPLTLNQWAPPKNNK